MRYPLQQEEIQRAATQLAEAAKEALPSGAGFGVIVFKQKDSSLSYWLLNGERDKVLEKLRTLIREMENEP